MKKNFYVSILSILMLLITLGAIFTAGLFYYESLRKEKTSIETENNALPNELAIDQSESFNENQKTNSSGLALPIDRFNERITLNPFGNEPSKMQLSEDQYSDLVCRDGMSYPGFHTAVDLEVTVEERNTPVSVFSIADGTVKQARFASGYGGLIVIEYKIDEKIYTAYYGHIDLNTAEVKPGSQVKQGQKIAELAPACSSENGNTRKHLHFGMRKGVSIDVSGYITDKNELESWIDPREIIK